MRAQYDKAGRYDARDSGPYRLRRGRLLGVCGGLAKHFNLPEFWVRFFSVMMMLMTAIWPIVGMYLVAAFLMPREPAVLICDEGEQEFYDSYAKNRTQALHRLKRKYESIQRRIQRMENTVTSRDYQWDQEMGKTS